MIERVVYLMRGLPSCGKSHTARCLAGDQGVVLETDQFFVRQQPDGTELFEYSEALVPEARRWNFERFQQAIADGISPIIVDRGNGRNVETRNYVLYARHHGYHVELREPDSPWWGEIRELLRDKQANEESLRAWADRLAEKSRRNHRVPIATILDWMFAWKWDLTVDDIANHQPR